MDSREYWKHREREQLKHNITEETEYRKCIGEIYDYMMDQIQREINGFYVKYAKKEGITLSEARKRVSKLDIEEYGRKAAKYVKEKDFSDVANEEMRLYNATMKINRLEMLKANIGLELVDGFNELQKYFDRVLTKRTLDEFERQAGILGDTVGNNEKAAHAIVNASFHHAGFSDRIWMYQDMMKAELSKLLQVGLIQGKHPRVLARHLVKLFGVRRSDAERLMQTELARVQTEAQKRSFERNGYDRYEFIALETACKICKAIDGKHFRTEDMMPGENAPPMHPNCRCSTAAYMDRAEFEKWLDEKAHSEKRERLRKQSESLEKNTDSDIIRLPRYNEVVIPKAKFTQYALNPDKDPDKARAFERALGYTSDNADELIKQINERLPDYEAVEKGDRGWGMTYEIVMNLVGPNGKAAKVLTGWIDDKSNGEMRLTTVHIDR